MVFLEPRLSPGGRPDGRRGSPGVAGDSARVRDRPDGVRAAAAAAAPREDLLSPTWARKNFSRETSLLVAPRSGPDSRTSPAPSERLLELILVPVTGTTPGADAARSRVPTDKIARAPISSRSTRPARASRHNSSGRSRRGDGGRVGAGATSPRAPYCVRGAPAVGGIASVAARDSSRWPVGGGLSAAPWERRHRADASAAPRRAAPARRSSTSSANSPIGRFRVRYRSGTMVPSTMTRTLLTLA